MKAVALMIEALALLNNEERKKERKKERRSAKWHFGPISVYKLPYGSGLQKGTASHDNEG